MDRAPTFTEIGARIREIRESKNVTQQKLADALNVSRPVVSKIESGKKAVNALELKNIADALGTTIDALMKNSNDEGIVARFRASGNDDQEFLEAVKLVEDLFHDIAGQLRVRRS
jgi:transcriptional regulator with XRE-family HTH domain